MSVPVMKTGTYTGTTAAQSVNCGFGPAGIIGWNITDRDAMYLWSSSDSTFQLQVLLAASGNGAPINSTSTGFSLSANDSIANENGKDYVYFAFKSDL